MKNRLEKIALGVRTIQNEFVEKFDSVLGKDTKQSNDNLSVFYKEDILRELKKK